MWCAQGGACGAQAEGECWLKHTAQGGKRQVKAEGAHVGWVSGSLSAPPAAPRDPPAGPLSEGPLGAGLSVMRAGGLELGLRNGTGSVELLSPLSDRAFSFVLPLRDDSLRMGRPTDPPLDRSERQYAHLGDANFRICDARPDGAGAAGEGGVSSDGTVVLAAGACARSRMFSTVVRRGLPGAASQPERMPAARPPLSSPSARLLSGRDLTALLPADSPLSLAFWIEAVPTGDSRGEAEEVQLWWQLELKAQGQVGAPSEAEAAAGLLVGSLGLPLPFNQFFAHQPLHAVAQRCSFAEAYPGLHGGYVQVTRARGQGPTLLALPAATADGPPARFEAWRPLREWDRLEPNYMYENSHELLLHSAAYAHAEWRGAAPWNEPTAALVRAGKPLRRGLRLRLAAGVEGVDEALHAAGLPVALPMPAPTITTQMRAAALWVRAPRGLSARPELFRTEPAGCVRLGTAEAVAVGAAAAAAGWAAFRLRAEEAVGRCRLDLAFVPEQPPLRGSRAPIVQSVHLFVTRPARELVRHFAATANAVAWRGAEAGDDPWGRFPAYFGTDANKGSALLEQSKVFMSGLSDEAGLAMPLAMAAKQLGLPNAAEVRRIEAMVHGTLLAPPNASAAQRARYLQSGSDYGVARSMLFWSDAHNANRSLASHHPELHAACHACWPKCWWLVCWDQKASAATWRAYNYPHVAAVYWALSRKASRSEPPLPLARDGSWYLEAAARTALGMWAHGGRLRGLAQWGLMGGSVFVAVLRDLQAALAEAEARNDGAASARWSGLEAELRGAMAQRVGKWRSLPFPFGSEFPWDSTGYEEVHAWLAAFGREEEAAATARAILGFVTLSPHWGFSGCARRYWDFGINGQLSLGNERELHHYAGTLNALPLVALYESSPHGEGAEADGPALAPLLLRAGAAATLGALTTIDERGFISMAWHGDPAHLSRDAYSADFGVGFLGGALLSRATVAWHEPFGWLCALCDFAPAGGEPSDALPTLPDAPPPTRARPLPRVDVLPTDAYGRRLFLAPLALLLTTDGASISRAALTEPAGCVRLQLRAEPAQTRVASLELELTARAARPFGELRVRCCAAARQCVRRATLAATPARLAVELSGGIAEVEVCWVPSAEEEGGVAGR